MPLLTASIYSPAIDKTTTLNIIMPEGKGPFPVLYLLHGLSDDQTMWTRRTSLERYAAAHRLMIVMPDGSRSFYCNHSGDHNDFEDLIARDVVGFIDNTFDTIASPAGRALAGLSMGGYGSIMLAVRHSDTFSVAVSHSGALSFTVKPMPKHFPARLDEFAQDLTSNYDLFQLTRNLKVARKLALRFDCGKDDFLIESNRDFHRHLDSLGIKHEYQEFPGEHNWDYWDAHIPQTLEFVMRHLSPKKARAASARKRK